MLGNGEKTTIGLISKKATLLVQHSFFVHFFAVVLRNYDVELSETSITKQKPIRIWWIYSGE